MLCNHVNLAVANKFSFVGAGNLMHVINCIYWLPPRKML